MRAIWYDRFLSKPMIKDIPRPTIEDHSVLLRVKAAGICRSDWYGWQGYDNDIELPHVPGHEFAGVVEEVGKHVYNWHQGDGVTTPFIQACGHCPYCDQGDQQVCENQEQAGFTYHGAFAEYVEVKYADQNLVRIPQNLSFETAAVMGCRFGTAFRAVVDQARVQSNDWVAIFGCGGVGLSCLILCKALGAKTVVIDPNAQALQMASKFGADFTYSHLSDRDAQSFIRDTAHMKVTIDAIGHAGIIKTALHLLKRRGKHIQVGLAHGNAKWEIHPNQLVACEIELLGSHGIQSHRYAAMLDFVASSKIRISDLIRDRCNLEEGVEKLMAMGDNRHHGIDVITNFSN